MDDMILQFVAETYAYERAELLGTRRNGLLPEARKMACYFMQMSCKNHAEIARKLQIDRSNIKNYLVQISFEMELYKPVKVRFKIIKQKMLEYLSKTKSELENWLKNNPFQDQKVREEKLQRLENINETYNYIINL